GLPRPVGSRLGRRPLRRAAHHWRPPRPGADRCRRPLGRPAPRRGLSPPVRYACEDLELLGRRRRALERDIERRLDNHDLGPLLTSIDGIGAQTAARLIAELGDPAQFRSAGALAAHVGVVPATRHSGKSAPVHASLSPIGHRRVRAKLWMPALSAIQHNPWIRAYYTGLVARGKLKKVAIVAAMRKLLIAVYAVAKTRRPFEPRVAAVETQA